MPQRVPEQFCAKNLDTVRTKITVRVKIITGSLVLGGRFGYFLFFFQLGGGGRGSPRRQEGVGVGFFF